MDSRCKLRGGSGESGEHVTNGGAGKRKENERRRRKTREDGCGVKVE
jgi:hypothetical protein